jgi:hypothetical protein
MAPSTATGVARSAKNSPALTILARTGYAVNGILHLLIGGIAIGVAAGVGGEADQTGALSALAKAPGGAVVLWVAVVGLAALGIWQLLQAFLVRNPDAGKRVAHTVGELARGIAYLAIAATALTFARGGGGNTASSTTSFSATLLASPGGVVMLVVLGVAVAAHDEEDADRGGGHPLHRRGGHGQPVPGERARRRTAGAARAAVWSDHPDRGRRGTHRVCAVLPRAGAAREAVAPARRQDSRHCGASGCAALPRTRDLSPERRGAIDMRMDVTSDTGRIDETFAPCAIHRVANQDGRISWQPTTWHTARRS